MVFDANAISYQTTFMDKLVKNGVTVPKNVKIEPKLPKYFSNLIYRLYLTFFNRIYLTI